MTIPATVDLLRRFVLVRRRELGYDQYDLAAAADVSKGMISMLEAGRLKGVPKIPNLIKLAGGLRVDPEILIQLSQGVEDQIVIDDGGTLKPIPPNLPAHMQSLGRRLLDPEREAEAQKRMRRRKRPSEQAAIPAHVLSSGPAPRSIPPALRAPMPALDQATEPAATVSEPRSSMSPDRETIEVPFFGKVGCGRLLSLDDYPSEFRPIHADLARGCDGLVEAVGDSMVGAGIYPGMTLVVKAQPTAENGQVVLVNVPYLGTAVRRLKVTQGIPYLVSQGPNEYPTLKMEGEVRIVGLVKHAYSILSFE